MSGYWDRQIESGVKIDDMMLALCRNMTIENRLFWIIIMELKKDDCKILTNAISNTYRLTYKCHTFLEMSGQGLPI